MRVRAEVRAKLRVAGIGWRRVSGIVTVGIRVCIWMRVWACLALAQDPDPDVGCLP